MFYVIYVQKNGLKFWKTIHTCYRLYKNSLKHLTGIFGLERFYHFWFRARNTEFYYVNPTGFFLKQDYAYWTFEVKALIVHS